MFHWKEFNFVKWTDKLDWFLWKSFTLMRGLLVQYISLPVFFEHKSFKRWNLLIHDFQQAVPELRQFVVASHSRISGSVLGDFMGDLWWTEWYWRRFLSKPTWFPPANHHSTIATHLSLPHDVCNSPDQATDFHILNL